MTTLDLGTVDLGWITVEVVMVGTTYDRKGTPIPVALVDIPGHGMTRLRGFACEYWEETIDLIAG